jgi:CBS domain-containing protein
MKVKDIMSKTVANLNPEDTVDQAAHLMKEHNVGSIPVCSSEKVIGIITDRDITLRSVADGNNSTTQKIRDIMSSNPVLGNPEMDVTEAGRIMGEKQIRRLPIVENNKLVGIISLGDIAVEPNLQDKAGHILSNVSEPSIPKI